jgi:hypothetical protein
MNKKKNTDILSIVQDRYRRESTISVSASIEDVRKTFEVLSETGMYVQYWKFDLRCNGRIIEMDWSRWGSQSIGLLTKITLEQQLDRNGTILNLNTQIPKGQLVRKIIEIFLSNIALVYILIYFKLDSLFILSTVAFLVIIDFISMYFDTSTDLLYIIAKLEHNDRGSSAHTSFAHSSRGNAPDSAKRTLRERIFRADRINSKRVRRSQIRNHPSTSRSVTPRKPRWR